MSADRDDTLNFPSLPPRSDAPASQQPRSGPDDLAMARAALGAASVAPAPGTDWAEEERRNREGQQEWGRQSA